jgi:hypothetical protein
MGYSWSGDTCLFIGLGVGFLIDNITAGIFLGLAVIFSS